jgi:Predicted P-loop ATPase and inactivated derivatives
MRLTVCITYNLDIKGDSAMTLSLVKSPENTSHENTLRQPDNSWKLSLKIDKHTGETTGCDFNLHMIVDNDPYFNSYELNLFSGLVVVDRSRDFCEDDIEKALKYIIYEYEISSIAKDKLTTAIKNRARDHSFNPVVDYLSGLTWDGVSRIDTWLTDYMGAENSEYSSRVGKIGSFLWWPGPYSLGARLIRRQFYKGLKPTK